MNTENAEAKLPSGAELAEALLELGSTESGDEGADRLPECYRWRIEKLEKKILAEGELRKATWMAAYSSDERVELAKLRRQAPFLVGDPRLLRLRVLEARLDGGLLPALRGLRNGYLGWITDAQRGQINRELEQEIRRWGGDATEHWIRVDGAVAELRKACELRRSGVYVMRAEFEIVALEIEPLEKKAGEKRASFRVEQLLSIASEKEADRRFSGRAGQNNADKLVLRARERARRENSPDI